MAYRPYEKLTDEQLRFNIWRLKAEQSAIPYGSPRSGQISNYYAPAIHYHEEELKLREAEL
jgi:hypothetical protein